MPVVIVQNWMELERGWGTRPDGFTVHASVEARNTYAQWYHATFNTAGVAPDEYTTTNGDAFPVDADDAVAAAIAAAPNGVVIGIDGATISVIDLGGGVAVDGCAVKVTTVKPGARLTFGASKFYVVVDP